AAEQQSLREQHGARRQEVRMLPIDEARRLRARIDWSNGSIPRPAFTGVRTLDDFPLAVIVPYIDWTPFFHAWELRGRFPEILEDETVGERAMELLDDAHKLLGEVVERRLLRARGVYGFFPANSAGDDIEIYRDE